MELQKRCAYDKVIIRAPASTSNLGPGLDIFGLALDVMYDTVEIIRFDEKIITIEVEGIGASIISTEPKENCAGETALAFLRHLSRTGFEECGFKIKIVKGIPPGSGLGSSGASAAATAVAINHLLDLKLNKKELTKIAAQGEIVAAGFPHFDNVAASIYGGFVMIYSYYPLKIFALPPSSELVFALAVPKGIKKTTKMARDILPEKIELSKYVCNLGATSAIIAGILLSNPRLIGQGMLGDKIIEPVRSALYPGCINAKKAAIDSGAFGASLSGAGPTVIAALDPLKINPREVATAMKEAFEAEGIECFGYVCKPTKGAQVVTVRR